MPKKGEKVIKSKREIDSKRIKTDIHKKKLLEALEKTLGNVTAACKTCNLPRSQHYKWIEDDENYKADVQAIDNLALDFVENKLINLINNEDTAATIFYLKCRGKKRGYVERQEIDLTQAGTINITVVPASLENDKDQG